MSIKCKGKTNRGKDCKNNVSLDGEKFCPAHGGASKSKAKANNSKSSNKTSKKSNQQEKPKPMSKAKNNNKIQCSKNCTTGDRCKLYVSLLGEKYCPRHGGLTKNGSVMKAPRSPIPWAALHSASLNFVIIEHSLCKCDARLSPCKSMQIMIWLQQLSSIVSESQRKKVLNYPSAASLRKWIEKAPLKKMTVKEMLLHASRILQVQNTRWLRDLMVDAKKIEKVHDEEKDLKEDNVDVDVDEDENENDVDDEEEDEDENENDIGDENENDIGDENGNGNDKGKEELVQEMMEESEQEQIVIGDEDDDDDEEKEYLPSNSLGNKKKTKRAKRTKSPERGEGEEIVENSNLKKTHLVDPAFATQNSPVM